MRPRDQVVEFRNYVTRPRQRDVLIDLFEREFVAPQEASGAHILATFRNIDDPDRFAWLRGFADLDARLAALQGFYTSDTWTTRRAEANAAITDSDDVLLLRPIAGDIACDPATRPPAGGANSNTLIVATTYLLARHSEEAFAAFFDHDLAQILKDAGADIFATFATEHGLNNFPRLPVRENETVFVSLTRFASIAEHGGYLRALAQSSALRALEGALARSLIAPTQTQRLQPTARSVLQ